MKAPTGIVLAAAVLGALCTPVLADSPPVDAKHPRLAPAAPVYGPGPAWPGPRRLHRARRIGGFAVAAGPVYGREPRYYPGAGGASPNAGFGALAPVPVAVVGYREPYIGRGLIYNVPPEPTWAVWSRRSEVISVRY